MDNAEIIPNDIPRKNAVGDDSPEKSDDEPPVAVLSSLTATRYSTKNVIAVEEQISCILRAMHFDFEESLWTADDVDAVGNLLCKYAHRFSKRSTDLGHVTVDPATF